MGEISKQRAAQRKFHSKYGVLPQYLDGIVDESTTSIPTDMPKIKMYEALTNNQIYDSEGNRILLQELDNASWVNSTNNVFDSVGKVASKTEGGTNGVTDYLKAKIPLLELPEGFNRLMGGENKDVFYPTTDEDGNPILKGIKTTDREELIKHREDIEQGFFEQIKVDFERIAGHFKLESNLVFLRDKDLAKFFTEESYSSSSETTSSDIII